MMDNILNINNVAEVLLWFLIFNYIAIRLVWKSRQKKLNLNNFEYWVYYNLGDLYKYNWYSNPSKEAIKTINYIKNKIRKWI